MERILFAKRLSLYLRSGIPLLEAIALIHDDTRSPAHTSLLASLFQDIQHGMPVSQALQRFPRAYRPFHIQLIAVGEVSGTLPDSLTHLAEVLVRRAHLYRSIAGALAYPAIILLGTMGISGFLIFFAFPKIVPLFHGLHAQLPFTTRSLIWLSSLVARHGFLIACSFALLCCALIYLLRTPLAQKRIHAWVLRVPLIGKGIRSYHLATIFRILAVLLHSGIRIDVALSLARQSIGNTAYQESLRTMEYMVLEGAKCSGGMRTHAALYPSLAVQLVATGEMTGTLSESARTIADIYDEALEEELQRLSILIEPMLMVGMGLVVGYVALAIISPMYGLTQNLSTH
jgi:type II secretory pathway component PulF